MLCKQRGAYTHVSAPQLTTKSEMLILNLPARVAVRHPDKKQVSSWLVVASVTVRRWIARSQQRRSLREIAESNDRHLLRDIGVSRYEAFQEADKPFWRQ